MAEKRKERRPDAPDLDTPSDADAPGPITPEHESGTWEQTEAEQEARDKLTEARTTKPSAKPSSSSSGKS